ncbi:hypothetical protein JTE90_000403 [Oedothorax gibbosus]|uniref:Uncharacterized protein n=1 Tax=Oedothorax gibbosus TaxID=931172 RepID=A0AAV6USX5_9ARAC|nr:hypothetical protein JTE90_000403 [Oedothorax gibbosus]
MDSSMVEPESALHRQQNMFVRRYHLPKSDYKSGRNKFRKYCIRLCKESLITGFPALASTRIGPSRRVLKALVLVVCVCGFLYQTLEFLDMYLEYPTMTNMQVDSPDSVSLPAIGLCNNNRLRRTAMCTLEPTKCIWNESNFCNIYPRYCIKDKDPMMAVPDVGYRTNPNRSFAYLNAVGQRREDLVAEARCFIPDPFSFCTNVVSEPVVNWEGTPNTCFTVESLWGQPDAQSKSIPVTSTVVVLLTMRPEEYMTHREQAQARVLVHDPRALANPTRDGIILLPGKSYNIYVSQTVIERQPAPYRTNCTDYLKLWRENGGRGPLTGRSCAEKCKMERMLQSVGCVPQSISYPNNNTICETRATVPSLEIMEGCSRECAEACHESTYHLRAEVNEEHSEECPAEDVNCKQEYMILYFLFNRFEVTTFVHERKFESVSLFSYIGGYVGMWLGVSLVALFDLAETLVNLLVLYPLSQFSRGKTLVV